MKLLGGIKHVCDGIWCGSYNSSFIYGKLGFIYKKMQRTLWSDSLSQCIWQLNLERISCSCDYISNEWADQIFWFSYLNKEKEFKYSKTFSYSFLVITLNALGRNNYIVHISWKSDILKYAS